MYNFKEKTILIIGGTGSLGKALLKDLLSLKYSPKKIIIFSRDEAKQHDLRIEYLNNRYSTDEIIYGNFQKLVEFEIGDIRSFSSIINSIKRADIIIYAAALKQVPICEYFPFEALQTNVLGIQNIINALSTVSNNVECVIGISTDKACKPINAYGMTKALMEKLFISANIKNKQTKFILTRYGNVLNSRGSIIPLFKEQIKNNNYITLTHPDMTRFFFSLDKAIKTIYDTIKYANPGEIFVPILNSFKIKEIIDIFIENKKIDIKIIGIRPGEKLHEELISEEEGYRTYIKDNYYVIKPQLPELSSNPIYNNLEYINKSYSSKDNILPKEALKDILFPYL
jgi:UDP-glucose 4-epimerase